MFYKYKIVKKTKLDELKDDVWYDCYKRAGFYDVYQMGQISTIEILANVLDKDYTIALLKEIEKSEETSDKIKAIVIELLDKYSKEPKFEI